MASTNAYAGNITEELCDPAESDTGFGAGTFNGKFYSWFELTQEDKTDCNTKISFYDEATRHFRVEWNVAESYGEDAIGGMGWSKGSRNRKIGYNVGELTTNSSIQKALVALYGWSCDTTNGKETSQEYYIVDTWDGGKFVPWDENTNSPAEKYGSVKANGAWYDVYKVGREGAQACFGGDEIKFEQFWSVRRSPRGTGADRNIDFRPHANRWDNNDMKFKVGGLKKVIKLWL
ncbi:glycoside hydrolase family 11 protein [Psychrosphaera algicola]|uniref:endo-1,4-beta-xylanase n=1 Tax=Psychrosphaera algicola TaxID=3023714 RepID=A0ABT5F8L4_9GAMM|nr:glycoside hydrolase family 11 protein [Psychrosphaera sp. G1-22]MDC2887860.1 glycoside hydrolase family 11 protein [Psychrosphaera sp. G1-22]